MCGAMHEAACRPTIQTRNKLGFVHQALNLRAGMGARGKPTGLRALQHAFAHQQSYIPELVLVIWRPCWWLVVCVCMCLTRLVRCAAEQTQPELQAASKVGYTAPLP